MTGKVYLVGAGPGDSKLITLRAVELIKKADVVLYDRLVSKKILSMIPKKAKKIYVGRAVGDDYLHQDSTNEQMVKYAKMKKSVRTLETKEGEARCRPGKRPRCVRVRARRCRSPARPGRPRSRVRGL